MTAKEYARECTPLNAPNREKFIEAVTLMLQDFTTIKCKEQRKLDGDMYFEKTYISKGTYKMFDPDRMREMIKGNKQPEV